jgi:hypothetical protein
MEQQTTQAAGGRRARRPSSMAKLARGMKLARFISAETKKLMGFDHDYLARRGSASEDYIFYFLKNNA